MQIINSYPKK